MSPQVTAVKRSLDAYSATRAPEISVWGTTLVVRRVDLGILFVRPRQIFALALKSASL